MFQILLLGFLLGLRHTLEADHLAAIATLANGNNSIKQATRNGLLWGLGHTLTLFLICALVLIFDFTFIEEFSYLLEFFVGLMLCGLGIDVIRRMYINQVHFHLHQHDDKDAHFHAHSHKHSEASNKDHSLVQHDHQHPNHLSIRAFIIGLVHGIAGSAVLVVLISKSIDGLYNALIYVLLFGAGSILGMTALSIIIAWPLTKSAGTITKFHKGFHLSVSLFTIVLGIFIMIENYPF